MPVVSSIDKDLSVSWESCIGVIAQLFHWDAQQITILSPFLKLCSLQENSVGLHACIAKLGDELWSGTLLIHTGSPPVFNNIWNGITVFMYPRVIRPHATWVQDFRFSG
ncbi:hypothetical protein ACJX0J_020979 [Zea mays]